MSVGNVENIRIFSQRCYPARTHVREYIDSIEKLDDSGIRTILKIILCSGFRIGEVLNAYMYEDEDGNVIARTLASKTYNLKQFGIKLGAGEKQSKFLGRPFLIKLIKSNAAVFKSVKLENIFNVDFEDVEDLICEYTNPRFVGDELDIRNYMTAYMRLKRNIDEIKIKYKAQKLEEATKLIYKPSFHFYRKLFSAEYYAQTKDVLKTVDKLKWSNINRIITYVKDY